MKSRNRSRDKSSINSRAFTLIETLVVFGIITLVMSVGAIVGIDSITRSTVHSDRNLLVSLLHSARTQALANIDEAPHGLKITNTAFITFEGSSYSVSNPTNQSIERTINTAPIGDTEFVFAQLTGNSASSSVTLADGSGSATVTVNSQGRIEW